MTPNDFDKQITKWLEEARTSQLRSVLKRLRDSVRTASYDTTPCEANSSYISTQQTLLAQIQAAKAAAQAAGNEPMVTIYAWLEALQQEYIDGLQNCHFRVCSS